MTAACRSSAASAAARRLSTLLAARADVLRRRSCLLAKRRVIQGASRVSADHIDSLIAKDWLGHLTAERRRAGTLASVPS